MLKIKIISVLIVLFFIELNCNPAPRKGKTDYEYVDENGTVIEWEGSGPPEGYEIVNEVVQDHNKGQTNAEVVDDVDISGFDIKGNYIGNVHAQNMNNRAKATTKQDQDYDEDEYEDEEEEEVRHRPSPQKSKYVEPRPKKITYLDIEKKYPGILERLKNSKNSQKNNNNHRSNRVNNEELDHQLDKAAELGIARSKPSPWSVNSMAKELDDLVQKDLPEDKTENSWNILGSNRARNKLDHSSYTQVNTQPTQSKSKWDDLDRDISEGKVKRGHSIDSSKVQGKSDWNNKDLNKEMNKLAPKTVLKSNQRLYTESPSIRVVYDSATKSPTKIVASVPSTNKGGERHINVMPGMDANSKVIFQQMSGSKGSDMVQITEQELHKTNNTNTNSTTGAFKGKYKDTILKPRRTPRILARYKVIIPVIVPDLRFRVPMNWNHSIKTVKP